MTIVAMAGESVLRLHQVSVVVTAEFHNPSILNRDFLVVQGIVPEDWEVSQSVITPPVSVVRYRNGIEWTVDQSRLEVVEKCSGRFRKRYIAHQLANAYLKKLPHVPYRSLGLNCKVSMAINDSGHWITERFLKPGTWLQGEPRILGMLPKFKVDAGDAVCHIAMNDATIEKPVGGHESAVAVDCNVHHAGPLGVNDLRRAIALWPERQDLIVTSLEKLLGESQT